jgi:hypothetical protein
VATLVLSACGDAGCDTPRLTLGAPPYAGDAAAHAATFIRRAQLAAGGSDPAAAENTWGS